MNLFVVIEASSGLREQMHNWIPTARYTYKITIYIAFDAAGFARSNANAGYSFISVNRLNDAILVKISGL